MSSPAKAGDRLWSEVIRENNIEGDIQGVVSPHPGPIQG